jgi:hypothetical protein
MFMDGVAVVALVAMQERRAFHLLSAVAEQSVTYPPVSRKASGQDSADVRA